MDRLTRKYLDSVFPKAARRMIRLHHADLPHPRKLPPHFMRYPSSNSMPPVPAHHKEL